MALIKHYVLFAAASLVAAHNTMTLERIAAYPENADMASFLTGVPSSMQMRSSSRYLSDDLRHQIELQNGVFYDETGRIERETEAMDRAGKSRLFEALDNPAAVQQLIAEGEDVNYEDFLGATPLHWIFSQESPNLESANIIRQNGGHIDSLDYQGSTPLEYAVRHAKSVEGVAWLLAKGADANAKTKQNLLLYASSQGKTDILQTLLEAGADPNTPRHFPPLFSAMGLGKLFDETVDLLLAHGADPVAQTNGRMTPLAYAARHGSLSGRLGVMRKVYQEAARRGTPYTAEQLSRALFEYRGRSYHRDFFEQFLEWNVDVNQKIAREHGGFTRPLIIACGDEKVDADALQHLLSLGAELALADDDGNTPLHAAIRTGAPDTVLLLLEMLDGQMIDRVNTHGQTALHFACGDFHSNASDVHRNKRFFRGPGGVEWSQDGEIRKLQDQVVSHGTEIRLVQALLSRGASPYVQDTLTGATPLHYASRLGIPEMVTALLEACSGKCLALKDNQGQTPLHWAAQHGKADVIQALMEWSQVQDDLFCVADKQGRLPLHLAAMKGHDDALDVLLEYTPATHYEVQDSKGRTPLWYATYWEEKDVGGWRCEVYRYDDCAGKLRRKMQSVRVVSVDPVYYAVAAGASLVFLVVVFRSAIAAAGGAVVDLGRGLCVVAWRWGVVAWRCAVAGGRSIRDEFHKS
ncbi:putative ankyrin repeat protein [Trichoderma austrokoningii]